MKRAKLLWSILAATLLILSIAVISLAQTREDLPDELLNEVKIIPFRFSPMVEAGKPFTVSWLIEAEGKLTHTDVHWRFISSPEHLKKICKKRKEQKRTLCQDKDYLDERSFKKGKEFKKRMDLFRDDTLVIPEPPSDKPPIVEMVIHAIVDGKNYYCPLILQIMPPGFRSPWGEHGGMKPEEGEERSENNE